MTQQLRRWNLMQFIKSDNFWRRVCTLNATIRDRILSWLSGTTARPSLKENYRTNPLVKLSLSVGSIFNLVTES